MNTVEADVRSSFTFQFLKGARMFADEASEIENSDSITEELKFRHKSLVASSIMHAVASLETEAYEIMNFGPGHHKGSNGVDMEMREFLEPLAKLVDRLPVLERYENILYLTKKPKLEKGNKIYQNAELAVLLRNEITHFKSMWGEDLEEKKFIKKLKIKKFKRPPFQSEFSNFFPHQVLGADCAQWTVTSCRDFLTNFYQKLGYPCRTQRFENEI